MLGKHGSKHGPLRTVSNFYNVIASAGILDVHKCAYQKNCGVIVT
jgi:hypothetical protein